ncbi:MAG TPA: hypothetical protein VFG84_06890 [Gemmatimonadaceae bacterium]|nr:hypothetical protein [Gemmatimonadaceae bacterium]
MTVPKAAFTLPRAPTLIRHHRRRHPPSRATIQERDTLAASLSVTVRRFSFIERSLRPLAPGIAGGAGSGKATVQPMHQQFVEPGKRHADIVVLRGGDNAVAIEMIVTRIKRRLQEAMA